VCGNAEEFRKFGSLYVVFGMQNIFDICAQNMFDKGE
jgi:hypothetical protein